MIVKLFFLVDYLISFIYLITSKLNGALSPTCNVSSTRSCVLNVVILLLVFNTVLCKEKICGEFKSENYVNAKGEFEIENFGATGSTSSGDQLNDSLLCIYKFVGAKNQKVKLTFNKFDIKSIAPDCLNEYIDIYIEVNDKTLNNYVETNFLSRWCGWKRPHVIVSYYNVIVFAYHTDTTERGSYFSGSFEFIDAEPFNVGRMSIDSCRYEFNSETIKSGMFQSPTYPGTYPNNLNCTYKFVGQLDERVSIHFEEIMIHYGADHCPYDSLKVYDFQKSKSELAALGQAGVFNGEINTTGGKMPKLGKKFLKHTPNYDKVLLDAYCGRKLNFTLYSTNNMFEIEFEMSNSLGNEEYAEDENRIQLRKGFRAYFTFSKYFADLSFITGTHITGTNCDQRITSLTPTGYIYSPNFLKTFTINATCKYIFEGINDSYNSESIKLNFYFIDLKPSLSNSICNDNTASNFEVVGADNSLTMFCYDRLSKDAKELRSFGSEMTLIFNSLSYDQYTPSNFKASYSFYTEFRIEGTRAYQNRTCLFTYNSNNVVHGSINSPRYPDSYPLKIRCDYIFDISSKQERILFTFQEFKLWYQLVNTLNCDSTEDNLSVYQSNDDADNFELIPKIGYDKLKKRGENPEWTLINRYCGNSMPSPFITDLNVKKIKLSFYSNDVFFAPGFKINYNYVRIPECKFYFYTSENISSGRISISSNELEGTYYCDWFIKTDYDKSLLFTFRNKNLDPRLNQFVIRMYDLNHKSTSSAESKTIIDDSSSASSSSVSSSEQIEEQIENLPLYEYKLENSVKYFQMDSSNVKLQLVIGKSMIMGDGKLVIDWITATKNKTCQPDEFLCNHTNYCIKSIYYCDEIEHCPKDFADEPENCFVKNEKQTFLFPPFIQITSFVLIVAVLIVCLALCILCRIKSIKKKQVKNNGHFNGPQIYYKYSPANSVDYLEAAITSV